MLRRQLWGRCVRFGAVDAPYVALIGAVEGWLASGEGAGRVEGAGCGACGDRAVACTLAGQIAALPPPPRHPQARRQHRAQDDQASRLTATVHQALGSDNVADLVGPLLDTQTLLATTHPDLARQVSDLAASTEQVRAADLNRRRTGLNPPPD
jgi:hypothetical protein